MLSPKALVLCTSTPYFIKSSIALMFPLKDAKWQGVKLSPLVTPFIHKERFYADSTCPSLYYSQPDLKSSIRRATLPGIPFKTAWWSKLKPLSSWYWEIFVKGFEVNCKCCFNISSSGFSSSWSTKSQSKTDSTVVGRDSVPSLKVIAKEVRPSAVPSFVYFSTLWSISSAPYINLIYSSDYMLQGSISLYSYLAIFLSEPVSESILGLTDILFVL